MFKSSGIIKILLRPSIRHVCFTKGSKLQYQNIVGSSHFHCSPLNFGKIFVESENAYLYNLLPTIHKSDIKSTSAKNTITCIDDLNTILNKNYRLEDISVIVNCFRQVQQFCIDNDINISNRKFDKLVDGLMDHVEKLSDNELLELLQILTEFPQTGSFQSHNFHDVWSALDDVCCSRITNWDVHMLLEIADLWYKLHCGRICDFIFEMLEKLSKSCKNMDKKDLVRCFFYFNIVRKKPIHFNYENALHKMIHELTIDEMAVVSLGYFKAQCRIKEPLVINMMIDNVIKNKTSINDITLSGILKVTRFTANVNTADQVLNLIDSLCSEIYRLSYQSVLHVALLGTTLQIYHPDAIERCCKRFLAEYNAGRTGRLKEVERLLVPITMFDHRTEFGRETVNTIFDDLHLDYRRKEMAMHPRCAPSALLFCSMFGLYSNKLMNEFLDADFIKETYGSSSKYLSREIFSLDSSITVDCPGYQGNRLGAIVRHKAARWQCEWPPTQHKLQGTKPSAFDSLCLNVGDRLSALLGAQCVRWEHVLPHFTKPDIILCKNLFTNQFGPPVALDTYVLGDVMVAPSAADCQYYALTVVGWSHVVRRTTIPLGQIHMKRRQLNCAGYQSRFIIWNEYRDLSPENKDKYLKMLLK